MTPLGPQLALAAGTLGALTLGLFPRPPRAAVKALVLAAPAAALLLLLTGTEPYRLPPLIAVDGKAVWWQCAILLGALPAALLASGDDVEAALLLGSTLGMTVLAAAGNAPMLFVGLELMSLPAYLLVLRAGRDRASLEAALKYFFAGALAGALFLLGMALYYAQTRSLGPTDAPLGPQGQAGLALMAAAALFKIGAVPLHWWLPDVYEGAPPEVAGFLSTAMKSAAVLFLMRVTALAPEPAFAALLPGLGALTAVVGALLALRQARLRRALAYSSLSHAGLLVLGVGAWHALGREAGAAAALLFYLGCYALLGNGAFLFVKASGVQTRAALRGQAGRDPALAAALAALAFSLGGVPPTGGFVAKLLVFWQALRAGLAVPALLGALAALLSLGFYLGLLRDAYFEEPSGPAPERGPAAARAAAIACAAGGAAAGLAPLLVRVPEVWR